MPESGDGISDLLEEAKWEAEFLAKMQDTDGGFYFLVYPKERAYEDDVLPDNGDPQVVWPKTTAATAAAVAALAQMPRRRLFKKQLTRRRPQFYCTRRSSAGHFSNGHRQVRQRRLVSEDQHYGHEFLHDDELAWAACELFLPLGSRRIQQKLM